MNTRKRRSSEKIAVLIDGRSYVGERVIDGTWKLDQYVVYNDQCIPDLHGYEPSQKDTVMLEIAKQILHELIIGKTISAQRKDKYRL